MLESDVWKALFYARDRPHFVDDFFKAMRHIWTLGQHEYSMRTSTRGPPQPGEHSLMYDKPVPYKCIEIIECWEAAQPERNKKE